MKIVFGYAGVDLQAGAGLQAGVDQQAGAGLQAGVDLQAGEDLQAGNQFMISSYRAIRKKGVNRNFRLWQKIS